MSGESYAYLRSECIGDVTAIRGLDRIRAFRDRVADAIEDEASRRELMLMPASTTMHKKQPRGK
jgi:hypothetical protein